MLASIIKLLQNYGPMFLKGTGVTLYMAAMTVLFGAVFGSFLYYLRQSKLKILNIIASIYVEVVRGTPMLLQIYMATFIIPDMLGLDLDKLTCVIIALILNSSAYVSELIRAGIQAVDRGQTEAARSLGMTQLTTMRYIVIPQAVKNILPALCNEFIMIIKDSSLGSVFFVGELMTTQALIKGALFMTIEPLIIVGAIYFVLTFTLSKLVGAFERRMAKGD